MRWNVMERQETDCKRIAPIVTREATALVTESPGQTVMRIISQSSEFLG
jgi:hypothetical protein